MEYRHFLNNLKLLQVHYLQRLVTPGTIFDGVVGKSQCISPHQTKIVERKMKKLFPKYGPLFVSLAVLLALIGCDKVSRMIEPDDGSQQTIIIDEKDEEKYEEDEGIRYLRKRAEMVITYYKWENNVPRVSFYNCRSNIEIFKPSIRPTNTVSDSDLGTVQLGVHLFDRGRKQYQPYMYIRGADTLWVTTDWDFQFDFPIDSTNETINEIIPDLSRYVPFTISNSPVISNLETEIYIPPSNYITNIQPGQVIDPNQDLTIKVRNLMGLNYRTQKGHGDFRIWIGKSEKLGNSGKTYNTDGFNFKLTEVSDTIVIPSGELLRCIRLKLNADYFRIHLDHLRKIAEVPLYGHDGNPYQTLEVLLRDVHQIEVVFKMGG